MEVIFAWIDRKGAEHIVGCVRWRIPVSDPCCRSKKWILQWPDFQRGGINCWFGGGHFDNLFVLFVLDWVGCLQSYLCWRWFFSIWSLFGQFCTPLCANPHEIQISTAWWTIWTGIFGFWNLFRGSLMFLFLIGSHFSLFCMSTQISWVLGSRDLFSFQCTLQHKHFWYHSMPLSCEKKKKIFLKWL